MVDPINWDCVRAILLAVDGKGDAKVVQSDQVVGFDRRTVAKHMAWMIREELLNGATSSTLLDYGLGSSLTEDGAALLEKIRSDEAWLRVKTEADARASPLSAEVIGMLADR